MNYESHLKMKSLEFIEKNYAQVLETKGWMDFKRTNKDNAIALLEAVLTFVSQQQKEMINN